MSSAGFIECFWDALYTIPGFKRGLPHCSIYNQLGSWPYFDSDPNLLTNYDVVSFGSEPYVTNNGILGGEVSLGVIFARNHSKILIDLRASWVCKKRAMTSPDLDKF